MGIRLGTKFCVVVSSPAAAKEVLRDQDAVFANRDMLAAARIFAYGGWDVAWNNDPESWRLLRKVCVRELLNSSRLDSFYGLRRSELRRIVREVYRRRGTPVGVGEVSFLTLLDLTTSMLWGSTVEGEEKRRVGKEFREVVDAMSKLLGVPNVSDLIPAVARFDLQGVERRMKRALEWFEEIISKIVDTRTRQLAAEGAGGEEGRRSSGSRGKDFLEVMLDVMEKQKGGAEASLTVDHVKAVILDLVVGGTETSSTTVEWAMAEMLRNPEILRKAQEELDGVIGRDTVVEESHLPGLRYLDAIVKETLRLHPVLPFLIPRSPIKSCTVGGHYVPVGTRVLINCWAIHRDPSSWEDPMEFRPERFLKGDAKWDYRGGNGFQFIPFGSGRRICIGITMAERMTMFLLAAFLHSFDWQLPVGVDVDLTESFGFTMRMAMPLTAAATPRLPDPQLYA